ncbi:aldehyde dehydrogenase family protein [Kocuria rhizophila]|nr:aldehyde dehydrogenase family protein [Kocuria rhizophila]
MAISVAVPWGRPRADRLRALLEEQDRHTSVGPSLEPSSDFGPVVSAQAEERGRSCIAAGEKEGAELSGGRPRRRPWTGTPTGSGWAHPVRPRHRRGHDIYREEIFGRCCASHRAADCGGPAPAQRTTRRRRLAIFTTTGTQRDFTTRVEVGMVGVNIPHPRADRLLHLRRLEASGWGPQPARHRTG